MTTNDKYQQLADEVNEAIKKSYKSESAEEKRSGFFLSMRKLNELKEAIREIPGGYITGLEKFENTLSDIEDEYYKTGVFTKELFSGWVYQTQFRLETPLSSLLNHGEVRDGIKDIDAVTSNQLHGGWIQKTTTFQEMGLDIKEAKSTFIASIVGPIPPNGGLFLDYLIELRRIVESEIEVSRQTELLDEVLSKQHYYDFNRQ